jgi:hypothetical protein
MTTSRTPGIEKGFVRGRTIAHRPTLQHRVADAGLTCCGEDYTRWPWRSYSVARDDITACLRCNQDLAAPWSLR